LALGVSEESPNPGSMLYDHNVQRFFPIFGVDKMAFFSKTNVMIKFLQKVAAV
jgi:hypothetical protein